VLLEDSFDDSQVDYSLPYEQLAKMRKKKREPIPLKLNDWNSTFIMQP
jgi:hypothetical protein